MIRQMGALAALLLTLSVSTAQAAKDPAIACGIKKAKIQLKYDQCLDKAQKTTDFIKRGEKLAKCHQKCEKGFAKAEEKYECVQEGAIGFYCGDGSSSFLYAGCRHDFFIAGFDGCYP